MFWPRLAMANQGDIEVIWPISPLWMSNDEEFGGFPEFALLAGGNCQESVDVPVVCAAGFDFDEGDRLGRGAGDQVDFA